MTLSTIRGVQETATQTEKNGLTQLGLLPTGAKHQHEAVMFHEYHALDVAKNAGKKLVEANHIWSELFASGKYMLTWVEWLRQAVDISRQTASEYMRIQKNWHLLKDLTGEDRSVRGAICFLRIVNPGQSPNSRVQLQ